MLSGTSPAHANLLTNGGFETDESTFVFGFPGLPASFGDWAGDLSAIVLAENSITPAEGARMLRFDATGNTAHAGLSSAEIYQLVDVSAFSSDITSGLATASVSAYFNRVSGDSETDTSFSISILALSGAPGNFSPTTFLDNNGAGIDSDGDHSTWESVSVDLLLPAGTDYLAVKLQANENIFNDGVAPEFDGHYADNISLEITAVPLPASIFLLIGALGTLPMGRFMLSKVLPILPAKTKSAH